MAIPLDFCRGMPRPVNWYCLILRRDYMWYDIWWTCEHVSRPCELVFALGLSLTSFHSVAVGFAILCFPRRILVNINALTVAFIEIWGNCPGLFLYYEHDFESPWLWNVNCWNSYIDYICWLAPVATDACFSVFIRSNIFWNRWKKIHKSVPEPRNGKLCRYRLLYSSGEIHEPVARGLFTLTINEHTTANVCLYFCNLE